MLRYTLAGRRRRQPWSYVVGLFVVTMFVGWLLFGRGGGGGHVELHELAGRMFRALEDTRPPECADMYDSKVGDEDRVSVIVFAFLNEESVVSETLASVIANTPAGVLKEVLVALPPDREDKAKVEQLTADAERYGSLVRVVTAPNMARNDVKSKFVVAHAAAAPVVAMLNDDVVVGAGWLPPLLAELRRRPQSVVVPYFDGYDKRARALKKVDVPHRWIFDWDFSVRPFEIGYQELAARHSEADVLTTPAFSGHAFAAYKRHLATLGGYKHDMNFAGGLEVSFLNWLCGDGVRIVPCSRMARAGAMHPSRPLDRTAADHVAHRYLDAASLAVYEAVNGASSPDQEQLRVEEGLKSMTTCKPFSWYLKEVARDVFTPDESVVAYGVLGTSRGPTCFKRVAQMTLVAAPTCEIGYSNQVVALNKRGQLRLDENCVKVEQNYALVDVCVDSDESQFWTLTDSKLLAQKSNSNRCLAHSTDPAAENSGRQVIMLADCLTEKDGYYAWQVWDRLRVLRGRAADTAPPPKGRR